MPPIKPFEIDPGSVAVTEVPDEESEGSLPPQIERQNRGTRWLQWVFGFGSLTVLLALVIEAVVYIQYLMTISVVLGGAVLILVILCVAGALAALIRELNALRKLRRHEDIYGDAERLANSELHGEAQALLKPLVQEFSSVPTTRGSLKNFLATANDTHNDRESLIRFERDVLAGLDRQAYRTVLAGSRDIGIVTALSPVGLLDSAFVLFRALMMVRGIARIYGIRPTTLSTIVLIRKCLRNAALAGVTDLVADAAIEATGASLASLVSAKAGQGMGNGLLAGRLGIEAIKSTRPLPFIAEEPPRIRHIRQSLFDKNADRLPGQKT